MQQSKHKLKIHKTLHSQPKNFSKIFHRTQILKTLDFSKQITMETSNIN